MPLTITTEDGQLYALELELATTVENLQLVVQVEVFVSEKEKDGIPLTLYLLILI